MIPTLTLPEFLLIFLDSLPFDHHSPLVNFLAHLIPIETLPEYIKTQEND